MSTPGNAAMLRRQLATELRQLRETAIGRTVAEVARLMGWSEAKLSRIETGKSGIGEADLKRLLNVYGVLGAERDRLTDLAAIARQRIRRSAGPELPDAYAAYITLESEASVISAFQPQVVHGLLQTTEYATALEQIASPGEDPAAVEDRVRVRVGRQVVLARDNPPRLCAILDEAALRRPIGDAGVMHRQFRSLIDAAERPMTEVLVLPFAAGAHSGLQGSFVLLDFARAGDPPQVYSEGLTGGVLRGTPEIVRRYRVAFESLRESALDRAESTQFIKNLAGEG